jgi:lactate dehydrogenase-like 2-hydroxyacid dehydrogenase
MIITVISNYPESLRIRSLVGGERLLTWDDLFTRSHVIVLAEPGTGKTDLMIS